MKNEGNNILHDELRLNMAEAAALPADDPRRQAVLRDVLQAGEWARREWIEMIAADEQLRLELMDVEVPPTLMARLQQVPENEVDDAPIKLARFQRWSSLAAIAATVVIGGLTWMVVNNRPVDSEVDLRLKTLAVLALDHFNAKAMPVNGNALAAHTDHTPATPGERAPAPRSPELPPHMKIVAAGKCMIGGHPVVCYHIEDEGRRRTIYQFSPDAYALPRGFAARTITPPGPWYNHQKGEVTFWTDEQRAYAIVNPGGEEAESVGDSTSGLDDDLNL